MQKHSSFPQLFKAGLHLFFSLVGYARGLEEYPAAKWLLKPVIFQDTTPSPEGGFAKNFGSGKEICRRSFINRENANITPLESEIKVFFFFFLYKIRI